MLGVGNLLRFGFHFDCPPIIFNSYHGRAAWGPRYRETEILTGVLEATVRDPSRSGPGARLTCGLTHPRKRRRRQATRPHFRACEASPEGKQGAHVNLPMALPFGLGSRRGICVHHRRCSATSFRSTQAPFSLVHIRTRICAGDPVQLKPATLLRSSTTSCRKLILKRLATWVALESCVEQHRFGVPSRAQDGAGHGTSGGSVMTDLDAADPHRGDAAGVGD